MKSHAFQHFPTGTWPTSQGDRIFDTLGVFVPNGPKRANTQRDSQGRVDILTNPVAWLWFILFWFR